MSLTQKSGLIGALVFGIHIALSFLSSPIQYESVERWVIEVLHGFGVGLSVAAAFFFAAKSKRLSRNIFTGPTNHLLESMSAVAQIGGWELDIASGHLVWTAQTRAIHEVGENFQPTLENALQFYPENARARIEEAVQKGIEEGDAWDLELPLCTAKGRNIWVRAVGQRMDLNGVPTKVYGAFQDITQQRAEREQLRNALADADSALTNLSAYQSALDQHAHVSIVDPQGKFLFLNDLICRSLGFEKEELLGRPQTILQSDKHSGAFYERYWQAVQSGETWHDEISLKAKDGSLFWMDSTVVPILSQSGQLEKLVAIAFDITARKELEASLRKNQAFLAEAAEVAKIGAWERILETKEPILSKEALALLEVDDDFVPTIESLAPYFNPEDMLKAMEAMDRCEEDGTPVEVEVRQTTVKGRNIWCLITGHRIETEDGGIRVAGAVQDITERKLASLELEKQRKQAEAAAIAKSQFLATMSHEIRTPMNGVLGMIELLNRSELSDAQRENALIAKESAKSLLAILDDILDFSKLDAEQTTLESIQFDLRTVADSVVALHSIKAQEKGLQLSLAIDENLPSTITGDPTRLRQILTNLIGNAIKFTESGCIDLRILRQEASGTSLLRFEVKDTGIGIAPEARERIFDRFAQEDSTTTRRFGGTGLGLAICKQLVTLMGGEIGIEGERGKGSTFWFTVPERVEKQTETCSIKRSAEQSNPSTVQKKLRILVAEDHNTNQKVVSTFLDAAGHDVHMVNNGAEALSALNSQPFDLILMDIFMPVMDGTLATSVIRSLDTPYKDIPIIALTANAMQGDRERYLAAGMTDYVSKPIDYDELLAAVARATDPGRASTEQGTMAPIAENRA